MNWTDLSIRTLIPELPKIFNNNFLSFKRYLDVIYDENNRIVIVPISTTGRIKGATIEGTTGVFDNLIVKNQFTNLYSNTNTADADFTNTYNGVDSSTRAADPSLGENTSFRYIDVLKSYYMISNDVSIAFRTPIVSQEFQLILDASSSKDFSILMDPSNYMRIDIDDVSTTWIKLICTNFDSSLGSYWVVKQYGGKYTINSL
jgi:hypothetical protein